MNGITCWSIFQAGFRVTEAKHIFIFLFSFFFYSDKHPIKALDSNFLASTYQMSLLPVYTNIYEK